VWPDGEARFIQYSTEEIAETIMNTFRAIHLVAKMSASTGRCEGQNEADSQIVLCRGDVLAAGCAN